MATSVKEMLAAANAAVPRLETAAAAARIAQGGALLLDVRDGPELAAAGKLAGAHHCSRGMLEFRADPESPYYDPVFDKARPVLLYCASGGRSALAGKVLKDMGYGEVYNLGGFPELAAAGVPTEAA